MSTPFDPDAPAPMEAGLFGLVSAPDEARVHVLGVPFDATTSYRAGAARGPAAILAASGQVDLSDPQQREWGHGDGQPWRAGIHYKEAAEIGSWNGEARQLAEPIIECGGRIAGQPALESALARVNELGGFVNERVGEWAQTRFAAGQLPVLLGGDHSIPFGGIRAAAEAHPGLGIFHIDAHADLRPAYEGFRWSHASIMHNVLAELPAVARLVSVGLRDVGERELQQLDSSKGRIQSVFAHTWAQERARGRDLVEFAQSTVGALPKDVWLSIDIDGLDPAWCPGTGTPVPGGLTWDEALIWLGVLANSGRRIVGLDLCEVRPAATGPGESDSWDAIVGARLLYKAIGAALASQPTT
ncbi:MAG: agmatinase [Candidatus Paceibacteria bacterium]|jgi:agmatinase